MKRLLCMILTGLMLFSAACTAAPKPQNAEVPTEPPAEAPVVDPTDAPTEPTAEPTAEPQGDEPTVPPIIEPDRPVSPTDDPNSGVDQNHQGATHGMLADPTSDTAFAYALAANLLDGGHNRNLSPISVYLALAMLAEGANGATQKELLTVLGCETVEELRGVCGTLLETLSIDSETSTIDLHNSLWMTESLGGMPVNFRADYLKALADVHRSEAHTVAFGTLSAATQIAQWIFEQTHGKIQPDPEYMRFEPTTVAVLINTIYLKDAWAEAFLPENTEVDTFRGFDSETSEVQDIQADFMRRYDRNVVLVQGDGWLRYTVRLSSVGTVTFVLPDEGIALDHLLGSPDAINKLLNVGVDKICNVSLRIPKFKFSDKMELEDVLRSMGLALSFTPDADFSGMADVPTMVDSVLQESYIGVDESGVEAAAYTMITTKYAGMFNPVQLETVNFHLDRPFLYAIQSYDGTLLFIGTVTEPAAHEAVLP